MSLAHSYQPPSKPIHIPTPTHLRALRQQKENLQASLEAIKNSLADIDVSASAIPHPHLPPRSRRDIFRTVYDEYEFGLVDSYMTRSILILKSTIRRMKHSRASTWWRQVSVGIKFHHQSILESKVGESSSQMPELHSLQPTVHTSDRWPYIRRIPHLPVPTSTFPYVPYTPYNSN
jgi:hypothetical protein